ncbi:MAG: mucoidy inhibitor MuiA family protein [Phycisphaerae bacterium]
MRKPIAAVLTACVLLTSVTSLWADAISVKGKVDAVTVYRGQALVTRKVDLAGAAGLREIVITDLPAQVMSSSLFAESNENVEIRSVLFRERAVEQDVREEVRKLDSQIRDLADRISLRQREMQTYQEQRNYLAKLEGFVAPTATVEMSKGVLNADTLIKLTEMQLAQRLQLTKQSQTAEIDIRTFGEQLNTLQRQRQQLADGSAKTVREAVVFVNQKAANANILFRYIVDSASWSPSYNVRADAQGKVMMEYNASIQQQSGEDWGDVAIVLSTATPNLVAAGPVLQPLELTLGSARAGEEEVAAQYENMKSLKKQIYSASRNDNRLNSSPNIQGQSGGNFDINGNPSSGWNKGTVALNQAAEQEQVLELVVKDAQLKKMSGTSSRKEEVTVTYDLTNRMSLPSRADQQLIQVRAMAMPAEFYRVATPLLSQYVYQQATLTNDSKVVLLAGPATCYYAGNFVGYGEVSTVTAGEHFDVGFGIDTSLRVNRERLEKLEVVQGGNLTTNYTYRLMVENFAAAPAKVRLLDRLPTAREGVKEADLKITLEPNGTELSKDAEYLRSQRKKGILRWDVEIPAQAIAEKAYTLDYKFKLEFDKQKMVQSANPSEPGAPAKMLQEMQMDLKH